MSDQELSEDVLDAREGPRIYRKGAVKTAWIEGALIGLCVGGVLGVGLVNLNHVKFCQGKIPGIHNFNPDKTY
jgi:hypothetical protein